MRNALLPLLLTACEPLDSKGTSIEETAEECLENAVENGRSDVQVTSLSAEIERNIGSATLVDEVTLDGDHENYVGVAQATYVTWEEGDARGDYKDTTLDPQFGELTAEGESSDQWEYTFAGVNLLLDNRALIGYRGYVLVKDGHCTQTTSFPDVFYTSSFSSESAE